MKLTKSQLKQIICEELDLVEIYYNSLKSIERYMDADELVGQQLWAHTNRTHRNQKKNGMIGLYATTSRGTRTGSPLFYTNALRLGTPIVFQVSGGKSVLDIEKTGKRTLVAGVSGTVIETNEDRDTEDFQEVAFNPFSENKYFHVAGIPDRPVVTADEVYFKATEDGRWILLAKNPRGSDEV